jgi:DNA-binding CsgD family transcriptional regulator
MASRLEGKDLSQPEVEVLRAAAQGLSAKETAARLLKSKHTIITQRRSVQAKLGARNLLHAVAIGVRLRLIDADPGSAASDKPGADSSRPQSA